MDSCECDSVHDNLIVAIKPFVGSASVVLHEVRKCVVEELSAILASDLLARSFKIWTRAPLDTLEIRENLRAAGESAKTGDLHRIIRIPTEHSAGFEQLIEVPDKVCRARGGRDFVLPILQNCVDLGLAFRVQSELCCVTVYNVV